MESKGRIPDAGPMRAGSLDCGPGSTHEAGPTGAGNLEAGFGWEPFLNFEAGLLGLGASRPVATGTSFVFSLRVAGGHGRRLADGYLGPSCQYTWPAFLVPGAAGELGRLEFASVRL